MQADDKANVQECDITLDAFGLSIQAGIEDATVKAAQITEPKSGVTNTTIQSLLEHLKVLQQLDEDNVSQAGFASVVATGQHENCTKTETPSAVDSSVTSLGGSDTYAYAGSLGGAAEPSHSLAYACCDLKVNPDIVTGPVKVQATLLKSLTCLDSTQVIPSPSVAFDYDIACQITGKAGPQTDQFDPGIVSPHRGYGNQPWQYSTDRHKGNTKEAGLVITAGQILHSPCVPIDPDKLPQYILNESKRISVLEQEKYHNFSCCIHKPVELVQFLADAVHNEKAAWKQSFLKIVAKIKHCLKALLWIRAD